MNEHSFSHSQFFLNIKNVPAHALEVRRVSCDNDGISRHYCFHVDCAATQLYSVKDWIRQQVLFFWHDTKTTAMNYRYGVIISAKYVGHFGNDFHYQLIMSSLLHPLLYRFTQRIFLNKSFNEIVSTVLIAAGFSSLQFKCVGKNNPKVSYRVQYHQSDYIFLLSLLREYDYQFVWQQTASRCVLMIAKEFFTLANTLTTIVPQEESVLSKNTAVDSPNMITVMTNMRLLQPGATVIFDNKYYRLQNIKHHILQNTTTEFKQNALRYYAEVQLVNTDCKQFIDSDSEELVTSAHTPLLTCKTESLGGLYPYLDENGCYFTRLPFDDSNTPATKASPPEYLLQPFGAGMHFPMQTNTEMVVSHCYGDINQPVLLGGIANPNTVNPVNDENNSQYIYRSCGGNQLLIDDLHQSEKIQLNNPNQQNVLLLDAKAGSPQIQLQSNCGQVNYTAVQNAIIQTQGCYYQNVQNSLQISAHNQFLLNSQQQLIQSGGNIALDATNINFQSITKAIQMNSQRQSNLISKNISIESKNDLTLQSIHLTTTLYGKNNITLQSNNTINIQSTGSHIVANFAGLMLTTMSLTINAQTIYCPSPT